MAVIGQQRLRGFHSRVDSSSPSLAILLLVHLRERAKQANRARCRSLLDEPAPRSPFGSAPKPFS